MDDIKEVVGAFLGEMDTTVCSFLAARKEQFPSVDKLLAKFSEERAAWESGAVTHTRGITEAANELCIAKCLLEEETTTCMEYEPPIFGTDKTIDFLIETKGAGEIYLDVKTVHPVAKDAWERYKKFEASGLFTENTKLVLDSDFLGGEIAHNFFAARQKFLEYTIEYESKIGAVPERDRYIFKMVFCGDGFRWTLDQLEDFADFYLNERHRKDDPFGKMEAHYMKENGIALARSIEEFCYCERKQKRVAPSRVVCGVKGPRFAA